MAKHRNNPNMPFWRMLKEGYDHFEVTHQEPKVDVCEKRYVFDAAPRSSTPANGVKSAPELPRPQPQQCPLDVDPPADARMRARPTGQAKDKQRRMTRARRASRTARRRRSGPAAMAACIRCSSPAQAAGNARADGTVRYMVDEQRAKQLGAYVSPPPRLSGRSRSNRHGR